MTSPPQPAGCPSLVRSSLAGRIGNRGSYHATPCYHLQMRACLLALTLSVSLIAADIPPSPSNVRSVDAKGIDAKSGYFYIEFTPASRNNVTLTEYLITVEPKSFCKIPESPKSMGSLPWVQINKPPFRVKVVCNCKKTITPSVLTAPVAGSARGTAVKGPAIAVPCKED